MIEDALSYPTNGENGLERLLVGGLLVLLPVFVLPAFLVYGYLVRSLAAVAAGEGTPPPFDEWGELFVDGLKAFVIAVACGAVPVVLAISLFVPVGVSVGGGGDGPSSVLTGLGVLAFLLFLAVAVVVAYVVMAALSTFAVEGRLRAAFDVRTIDRLATSEPYVVAVVLAVAIQVALGLAIALSVVFTLGLVLLVLVPLGAFVNFWAYLATVCLFGAACREAMGDPA